MKQESVGWEISNFVDVFYFNKESGDVLPYFENEFTNKGNNGPLFVGDNENELFISRSNNKKNINFITFFTCFN